MTDEPWCARCGIHLAESPHSICPVCRDERPVSTPAWYADLLNREFVRREWP